MEKVLVSGCSHLPPNERGEDPDRPCGVRMGLSVTSGLPPRETRSWTVDGLCVNPCRRLSYVHRLFPWGPPVHPLPLFVTPYPWGVEGVRVAEGVLFLFRPLGFCLDLQEQRI